MNKEAVGLHLDGVTSVRPFRDYYEQRNGTVAQYLARYLNLPYQDSTEPTVGLDRLYTVPAKTLLKSRAHAMGIETEGDFYGAAVEHLGHVGKAILHPTISEYIPSFYSPLFAREVHPFVLPGLSAFSREDALESFLRLKKASPSDYIRFKAPNESDGHGQYAIATLPEARKFLNALDNSLVQEQGLVLELGVQHPSTISAGFAQIGTDRFSFIADQKNDRGEDGRDRYAGCNVAVVRGSLFDLYRAIPLDTVHQKALESCAQLYEKYSQFDPIASRLSFDYVYGHTDMGDEVGGVTDITARLGGTCPALVLAAEALHDTSKQSVAQAEVTLNYEPEVLLPEEQGAINFIDEPTLRLSARLHHVL
ncbi:MAG: DUF3182 family protein [Candidatus Roizmanbacteria bacterium]|nr:DUF3182 family protein [Candidatus Roizmanbacteria bacterium]